MFLGMFSGWLHQYALDGASLLESLCSGLLFATQGHCAGSAGLRGNKRAVFIGFEVYKMVWLFVQHIPPVFDMNVY